MDTTVAGQRDPAPRSTPRVETVVVGGGQAGLAVHVVRHLLEHRTQHGRTTASAAA